MKTTDKQREHEILSWLIGLISTDGSISIQNPYGCHLIIGSKEKDWLERIKKTLATIGIKSNIYTWKHKTGFRIFMMNNLRLLNPRQIIGLFQKYPDLQQFCNPRKWKLIQQAILYYEKSIPHWRYSANDIDFIKAHYKSMSDKQIAEALGKGLLSASAVKQKRQKLNLWHSDYYWSLEEKQFLRENYLNFSHSQLAEKLKRSKSAVEQKRRDMKLFKSRIVNNPVEKKEEI